MLISFLKEENLLTEANLFVQFAGLYLHNLVCPDLVPKIQLYENLFNPAKHPDQVSKEFVTAEESTKRKTERKFLNNFISTLTKASFTPLTFKDYAFCAFLGGNARLSSVPIEVSSADFFFVLKCVFPFFLLSQHFL